MYRCVDLTFPPRLKGGISRSLGAGEASTARTKGGQRMKHSFKLSVFTLVLIGLMAAPALAQSGHFVGTPTCTDIGTQVRCTGRVAGLGGTTFTITVSAPGTASVECTNPGGNVAPGQSFTTTVTGTSGPFSTPRNGQARFTVVSAAPSAGAGACPNNMWTARVSDVTFTGPATITLREDGAVSDTITVPIS
jgi:hypothetical protein